MKTDDLISRLATQTPPKPLHDGRMALLIGLSIAGAVAVFLALFGTRRDLGLAWENPVVPIKTFLPLVLCLLSGTLLLQLTRPEARVGRLLWLYAVPGVFVVAMWITTFIMRAPADRFAEVGVLSLAECLGLIPLIAVVPTIAVLRILRQGASAAPRLSAALAGLTAASGSAAGYSLFCIRDNPLFFLTWYGLAILLVTIAATHFGKRILAW
jgi:hypothetical protein